jgi:hypothetical protein
MTDLKRRKLLFKAKTQPANSSNGQRGDERHNKEVDGWMHSRYYKIVDLVEEYLRTKEKKEKKLNGRGRVRAGSRK